MIKGVEMKISRIDAPRCLGGENPLWDVEKQVLYFIDNSGKKIHCYNPVTDKTESWTMPAVITTLALRETGNAVVTLMNGIHFFDFDSNSLDMLLPIEGKSEFAFN